MLLVLLWPALWNGFPIVFYDTGGYIVRMFEPGLGFGRSALYGAFLDAGITLAFWPAVAVQAAVSAWMVVVILRLRGLGGQPMVAAAIVVGVSILTGAPWFTAQLMPDVWLPLAVLGLYLLAFHLAALRGWERSALAAVIAFAIACHMSTLAVALGLVIALAVLRPFAPRLRLARPSILAPGAAVALGLLLAPVSNYAIAGRFTFTPGGANFAFVRLVEEGIAARFLAEHCPDPAFRICAYRDEVPTSGNEWLWGDTPLWSKLGGPLEFEAEAGRIVLRTLVLYPGLHVKSALQNVAAQTLLLKTMDHFKSDTWHTKWAIETYAPGVLPAFLGARQQRDDLALQWLDAIYIPVTALAIVLLPVIIVLGGRGGMRPADAALALVVLLALAGNAVICGSLSIPADRYQSRLAWLAPLAVAVAALGRRKAVALTLHGRDTPQPS